jgi:hypothetical protein
MALGCEARIERIKRKMTGRRRHGLISGSSPDSDIPGATILLRKPVMLANQVFPGKAFL